MTSNKKGEETQDSEEERNLAIGEIDLLEPHSLLVSECYEVFMNPDGIACYCFIQPIIRR